jgi:hypothetical protein
VLRKRFVNPNEAAVTSKAEQRVHISDEFLYNTGDFLVFVSNTTGSREVFMNHKHGIMA